VPDELNVYLAPRGFHLFFPMAGANRWRVIGILPDDMQSKPDLSFQDVVPSLRHDVGAELSFASCLWFSTYRIHHRCTERFRDRRCFVLGDAAHVHSPMGGQGMNTGLQDAYNLAWKLALVATGQADDTLLDSYEAERHPVALRLLATTDRAFRFVVSDSWWSTIFRTYIMPNALAIAMKRPQARLSAFSTISQLGIRYRQSPLSRTLPGVSEHAPQAGDRFPWLQLTFDGGSRSEDLFQRLDDTRFNLLVIGQRAPSVDGLGLGDLLEVHAAPLNGANARALEGVSITAPAFYLLRPDGHVALAGGAFDEAAVRRWFADWHVRPTAAPVAAVRTV
jgi:hypothetical protein